MIDLACTVLDVAPERYAATPTLLFRVRLTERTGESVHALALRCQVRIEPQRRPYDPEEAEGLTELFGGRERWSDTMRPFLWTHTSTMVRGFTGDIEFDLPVACTYDFEVAAAKYLHALRDGDVPVVLLFSGTAFTRGASGFEVHQVAWDLEASYRMPAAAWRQAMDLHFPNSAWLRVRRDTLDALVRYRQDRGLLGWDDVVEDLLAGATEVRA